jgi:hypothetical protein
VTGKVELYLGSMESKHTTRFTRKQRNKRKRCVYILTDFAIGSLVILDTIERNASYDKSGLYKVVVM